MNTIDKQAPVFNGGNFPQENSNVVSGAKKAMKAPKKSKKSK